MDFTIVTMGKARQLVGLSVKSASKKMDIFINLLLHTRENV